MKYRYMYFLPYFEGQSQDLFECLDSITHRHKVEEHVKMLFSGVDMAAPDVVISNGRFNMATALKIGVLEKGYIWSNIGLKYINS